MLKRIIRWIDNKVCFAWIGARIYLKWLTDCRRLPLTSDHWELYQIIHRLYWKDLRDFPNLVNCRDFNDRMQWLKLFDQSEEIIRCSDKITVRDYVKERVGEKYLVELYQVCDHFSQINFKSLPKSFVIKTNHDSGSVILVRDKSKFDSTLLVNQIESSLKRPYGWDYGEWAYSYIKPRILIEEYIDPDSSRRPIDYKFYVVNGKVKFCHLIFDRGIDPKEQTVDAMGHDLATELYPSFKLCRNFIKPKRWDEMISIAEAIGNEFKCVRVDLYNQDGLILVGEMTFWPMAGRYKGDGQKILGRYLDFDRSTFKPFMLNQLEKRCSRFSLYPVSSLNSSDPANP